MAKCNEWSIEFSGQGNIFTLSFLHSALILSFVYYTLTLIQYIGSAQFIFTVYLDDTTAWVYFLQYIDIFYLFSYILLSLFVLLF